MEDWKHEQCKLTASPVAASSLPSLAACFPPAFLSPREVWSPHLSHVSPSYLLLSSQFMGLLSKCFDSNWENKLLVPSLSPGPDSQNKPGVEENVNGKVLVCLFGRLHRAYKTLNTSGYQIWASSIAFPERLCPPPLIAIPTCDDSRTVSDSSSLAPQTKQKWKMKMMLNLESLCPELEEKTRLKSFISHVEGCDALGVCTGCKSPTLCALPMEKNGFFSSSNRH